MSKTRFKDQAPYGQAYIFLEYTTMSKHAVFRAGERVLTLGYDCHGCWHNCGGGHVLREHEDPDEVLKKEVERIKTCKTRDVKTEKTLKPVKISVFDARKTQTKLTVFQRGKR